MGGLAKVHIFAHAERNTEVGGDAVDIFYFKIRQGHGGDLDFGDIFFALVDEIQKGAPRGAPPLLCHCLIATTP